MSYNLDAQRRALMDLTPPPLPGQADEKADERLALTTCSRLRCEECNVELPASREETPVLTAVKAKNAGVWVKNFIIYGDESGYHYFCSADHGKAWRIKNIPSANSQDRSRPIPTDETPRTT